MWKQVYPGSEVVRIIAEAADREAAEIEADPPVDEVPLPIPIPEAP